MTNMVGRQMVKNSINKIRPLVAALVFMAASSAVQALHFEPTDELQIDLDTTLAYGAMWRVEEQEKGRMGIGLPEIGFWGGAGQVTDSQEYLDSVLLWNSDDGNRNFDKGDLVSNRMAVTSDMDMKFSNMGFFLRAQVFYDSVYFEETSWDGEGWDYWGDPAYGYNPAIYPTCGGNPAYLGCGTYVGPETINNAVADHSVSDPKPLPV